MVLFQNCVRQLRSPTKIHSAVALLLKAALIQVSDYRLLGASGFVLSASVMRGRIVYRETGRMDKHTPCPPPLLWYSFFAANSLFSTHIFQILHITFAYSEGGMDRQGYASPFSRPLLLPLLFSPSSRPSSPFSQPASPFPWPFLPVSLCPVHFLSETPLSRHRNVYVKLTPQSGQPLKTIRIFWSHR